MKESEKTIHATKMSVIINIQQMKIRINNRYKRTADFVRLAGMSVEELRTEQETLIPVYNQVMNN